MSFHRMRTFLRRRFDFAAGSYETKEGQDCPAFLLLLAALPARFIGKKVENDIF